MNFEKDFVNIHFGIIPSVRPPVNTYSQKNRVKGAAVFDSCGGWQTGRRGSAKRVAQYIGDRMGNPPHGLDSNCLFSDFF
jgi:hypothetical protein